METNRLAMKSLDDLQPQNPGQGFQFPGVFEITAIGIGHVGLEERVPEIGPGRFPQQADERQDEEGGAQRCDDRGGERNTLSWGGHGGRNPELVKTRCPGGDST